MLPWNIPVNAYLHGVEPDDERVDVLLDDLTGWPPTFVVYGADEMFRDAIRALVEKLEAAEVPHVALEVEGMFHVFPFLLPWTKESRERVPPGRRISCGRSSRAVGGDSSSGDGESVSRLKTVSGQTVSGSRTETFSFAGNNAASPGDPAGAR